MAHEHKRNERFYQVEKKRPATITIEKYKNEGLLSDNDERLIYDYVVYRKSANVKPLSDKRQEHLKKILCYWRRYVKSQYNEMTIDDIRSAIAEFKTSKTEQSHNRIKSPAHEFKQNSQSSYIGIFKSFCYWLIDERGLKVDYLKVKKIPAPSFDTKTTKSSQLFSYKDIRAMIDSQQTAIRRAFIAIQSESMARPEECSSMVWGDLKFNVIEHCVEAAIPDFKNGGTRPALLTYSSAYLSEWKKISPAKADDDFIFVYEKGGKIQPYTYGGLRCILFDAYKKAGIDGKQRKLYNFRKSKITAMHKNPKMSKTAINQSAWGHPHSKMDEVYVKLSGQDSMNLLKRGHGINVNDNDIDITILSDIECPRCHTTNEATADHCKQCGEPISERAIRQSENADNVLDNWLSKPENLRKLLARIENNK